MRWPQLAILALALFGCMQEEIRRRTWEAPWAPGTQVGAETAPAAAFPPLTALPAVTAPLDNPITPEKVELGRLLFFDNRLSGDLTSGCAACHAPELGWGDGNPLSLGYPGTQHWRNSQTIVNRFSTEAVLGWRGDEPRDPGRECGDRQSGRQRRPGYGRGAPGAGPGVRTALSPGLRRPPPHVRAGYEGDRHLRASAHLQRQSLRSRNAR